jgi:hypothetical protein
VGIKSYNIQKMNLALLKINDKVIELFDGKNNMNNMKTARCNHLVPDSA